MVRCEHGFIVTPPFVTTLFHDLFSRSYVYLCVWSVILSDILTPPKHDESFSTMFSEP